MLIAHEQINLFGGASPLEEIINIPKRKRERRKTMQELYGHYAGIIPYKCKDCQHLAGIRYSKVYYKCSLWHVSHSAATDIRVNKAACAKFELRQGKVKSYMGQ